MLQNGGHSTGMNRDNIYALPRNKVGDFAFDEEVVRVFPDMIARSVPGYASILSMIEQLGRRFIQPQSRVYDLGCSLGAATLLLRGQAPTSCELIAVDSSPAMVARLKETLGGSTSEGCRIEVHEADIRDFPVERASFVVLNFTLQFVPAEDRQVLLRRIYDGLLPQGGLLLSEKICAKEAEQQALLTDLHHDFKRAHGYSDLEISQKRTAIENRLIPETLNSHTSRLEEVGFPLIVPWFQCFNFASILAVKTLENIE